MSSVSAPALPFFFLLLRLAGSAAGCSASSPATAMKKHVLCTGLQNHREIAMKADLHVDNHDACTLATVLLLAN